MAPNRGQKKHGKSKLPLKWTCTFKATFDLQRFCQRERKAYEVLVWTAREVCLNEGLKKGKFPWFPRLRSHFFDKVSAIEYSTRV